MLRILYQSTNLIRSDSPAFFWTIATLLSECLARNARCGITGALMFGDGRFLQVLEGPEDAIDAIFMRINCDCRHQNVRLLSRTHSDKRLFAAWTMAFVGPPIDVAPIFGLLDAPVGGPNRHCGIIIDALASSVNGAVPIQ